MLNSAEYDVTYTIGDYADIKSRRGGLCREENSGYWNLKLG